MRENVQKSHDGKLSWSSEPVMVIIKIGKIDKEFIPGLEDIKERISCLQGRNSYIKEIVEHIQNKMNA